MLAHRSKVGAAAPGLRRVRGRARGVRARRATAALAFPVVALLGYVYFLVVTCLSTVLQDHLPDEVRGRVMALWIMGFGGTVPLGVLVAGPFSEHHSTAVLLVGRGLGAGARAVVECRKAPSKGCVRCLNPTPSAIARLRGRVREIVESADAAAVDGPSPATPGWTVHDVLAHLVGVTDDVVHRRLDGIATDPWTAAQVEARRGVPATEMLDEWDAHAGRFEQMIGAAPMEIAGQALFDAATHEHDIRCALGRPGARDSDALALAWEWLVADAADNERVDDAFRHRGGRRGRR